MSKQNPIRPGQPSTLPGGGGVIVTPAPGGAVTPPEPPGSTTTYEEELNTRARVPIYQIQISERSAYTAYWKMDEASGTRFDSVGTQHFVDNNTVFSLSGILNSAAEFDPTNLEYLDLFITSFSSPFWIGNTDPFAWYTWVRLDSKATDMHIIRQWGAVGERLFNLRYDVSDDRFIFQVEEPGGSSVSVTANAFGSPPLTTWIFLGCGRDIDNGKIFIRVDATYNEAAESLTLDPTFSAVEIAGGFGATGLYFDGRIDETAFFRRIPSDVEWADFYHSGAALPYGTGRVLHEFCTSWPVTNEVLGLQILSPVSLDRRVDAEYSRFPLSELIVDLINFGGVTLAAVTTAFVGLQLRFYAGFYDLTWAGNNVQMFNGFITDVDYNEGVFRITARSFMAKALSSMLFNGAQTRLTAAITSTDVTLAVVDATAFEEGYPLPVTLNRTVLIENDPITYRGRSATSLTDCIRQGSTPYAIPPAFPAGISAAHAAGEVVLELLDMGKLSAGNDETIGTNNQHPVNNFFINILTTTDPKRAIGDLGIELDTTKLSTVTAELGAALRFRFLYTAATNAKKFVEEELCQVIGGYPTEDNEGKIGIKLFRDIANFDPVGSIDDDHLLEIPKLYGNSEKLMNSVTIHYDHNPYTSDRPFASTYRYRDDTLVARHGRPLTLEMDSRGLRSFYESGGLEWFSATSAFLEATAQRIVGRFGDKCQKIRCKTSFNRQLLNVGDDVLVNFSQVEDTDGGMWDITDGKFEIVGMHHDFLDDCIVTFDLLEYPAL